MSVLSCSFPPSFAMEIYKFIEIDRPILEKLGFKNRFIEKKNKEGIKRIEDSRKDFNHAIRFLRNAQNLTEGTTFENTEAHYIILKNAQQHKTFTSKNLGGSGLNKQDIWIRNDVLQQWMDTATFVGKNPKNFYNGLVYFVHMENNMKMFKIGYSTNMKKRLLQMQGSNPYLLIVYRTIENSSKQMETKLHQHFHKYHIRGEWFAITPDMVDDICDKNKF